MRDNCAEDSSPVSREESDNKLFVLAESVFFCLEDAAIEESDSLLESNKLDDCVGDLSHPERNKSLVESIPSLVLHNLVPCNSKVLGE